MNGTHSISTHTNGSSHLSPPTPSPTSATHHRKLSSPQHPPFLTSAPGKVIVFGEHAVVHGASAIAASISLRSYLLVTTLSKSKRSITLKFPDIALDHTWAIDALPWKVFHSPGKKKSYADRLTKLDEELVAAMQPFVSEVSPSAKPEVKKIHQAAASAFLYLFLSLASPLFPGSIYALRSTLPIGAGLGSSASIAVCLSSALLLQIRALSGPHADQPTEEASLQIERINHWAYVAEMCMHGNPSGVDNTVSSAGKAVKFQRKDYTLPPSVEMLKSFPELPLLLINTKQSRSTAVEVAKVSKLLSEQPVVTKKLLDAINSISDSALDIVSDESFSTDDLGKVTPLGQLFELNHGLLVSLGVSHPRLERIRELVAQSEAGWTKLTGAGGGGCAITLLKPGEDTKMKVERLREQLESEDFEIFDTTLAGDGVGVLMPAILKRESEEGGVEVDLERFLDAEGRDGVDELVGVSERIGPLGERREGWKFWN